MADSLRTNGLPEALIDSPARHRASAANSGFASRRSRAGSTRHAGRWIRRRVVVEGAPPSVRNIDIIELEPGDRGESAHCRARRRDPLSDPRQRISTMRAARCASPRAGTTPLCRSPHPWTAGASHPYTREFMELAHDHLNPGGVFVQWMNVIFMDEELIRSLTATLLSVFPEVRVYRADPNTIVFLASDAPLELETNLVATGLPLREAPLHYARFGINNAEDLVTALVLDTDGARRLAVGARLITDDDNRIATSSVFEMDRGMTGESSGRVLAAYDPWQRPDSLIYGSLREQLSFPYMIRRNGIFVLIDASVTDRLVRMSQILGNSADGEYARAFYYRMSRQGERSNQLLRLSIDQYPDNLPLRQEYLRDFFAALARGEASPDAVELASALKGPPAELLAATRHAAKNEWQDVAMSDLRLAEIPWTDAWYGEARTARQLAHARDQPRAGASLRRRVDLDDRSHDHHESNVDAVRHAHSCRLCLTARQCRGRVRIQLCATGVAHGACRRDSPRRSAT
jgi:hypothetical protein